MAIYGVTLNHLVRYFVGVSDNLSNIVGFERTIQRICRTVIQLRAEPDFIVSAQ